MKIVILYTCFGALMAVSFAWEFPGNPGTNCIDTREIMQKADKIGWMIPECNSDGTFVDLQCYYPKYPEVCMCVAPDGSPLTLPGFGNVTTCDCPNESYKVFGKVPDAQMPDCAYDGYFKPMQCDKDAGLCWCVDKKGKVLSKPSKDTKFC